MEVYKDIKGYEGVYQVSNLGNVKSLERKIKFSNGNCQKLKTKILKGSINGSGYLSFGLMKNKTKKEIHCHILVAVAFLGYVRNGKNDIVVDHVDNNKLNNNLDNLQIITHRENCSKDVKNKTSKYTGVSWDKNRKKWSSKIKIKGKTINLGRFKSEYEAHLKYQNKLCSL